MPGVGRRGPLAGGLGTAVAVKQAVTTDLAVESRLDSRDYTRTNRQGIRSLTFRPPRRLGARCSRRENEICNRGHGTPRSCCGCESRLARYRPMTCIAPKGKRWIKWQPASQSLTPWRGTSLAADWQWRVDEDDVVAQHNRWPGVLGTGTSPAKLLQPSTDRSTTAGFHGRQPRGWKHWICW